MVVAIYVKASEGSRWSAAVLPPAMIGMRAGGLVDRTGAC
jgi:hypothetical protein